MSSYDFSPLEEKTGAGLAERPPISYWKDAWIRLRKNKTAVFSFGFILFAISAAAVGPFF